jgi:CHAT domain-containing protein
MIRSGEDPAALARKVAAAVLGDLVSLLPPSVRRVVLVPDGPLHLVPFDALTDGDGSPLVERFAFSVQPSASLAVQQWRSPPAELSRSVLALGDPRVAPGTPEALRPLPNAAREAREAARHGGPGSVVLLGADASEARLGQVGAGEFGVLHFATHARLDEASLAGAALLLAPGDGEDGVVRAGEVARMRLDAGLAFLSGCSTASGTVVRGEGVVGLASALRVAGVRTVILTRWPLEDRAAERLVDAVYAALSDGLPVGDAVRSAKFEARARGAPAEIWATLTVVGDERLTVPLSAPYPWRPALALLGGAAILLGFLGFLAAHRRPSRA